MNIFQEINKLNFKLGHYVVAGSGPMAAHGIKDITDIDIVVTPELFEKCKQEDWEQIPWTYPDHLGPIFLRRGFIELYTDVNCGNFNPTFKELLQRADIIQGIPFASLEDVMKFKNEYNKPKHLEDIRKIENYLKTPNLWVS